MWRSNIIFLFALGSCCHAWAQNVVFTATPNANKIGVKDQLQVTFTVKDCNNLRQFSSTGFGEFTVLAGPMQSEFESVENGVHTSSVSLTYVLRPKHEGHLTIPGGIARDASGHTYQSNTVTVDVVPGLLAPPPQQHRWDPLGDEDMDPRAQIQQQLAQAQRMHQQMMQQLQQVMPQMQVMQAPPPPSPQNEPEVNDEDVKDDLFIRAIADKNKVKVGEQVIASYKLYTRIPWQLEISKPPAPNGFYMQDYDLPREQRPTEEVINGKRYLVFLLKKSALFPQKSGTLELEPAEARGLAQILTTVKHRVDPFGGGSLSMIDPRFNNAFFITQGYKSVKVHLKSTTLKIQVDALPEKDKPANYGGAVGNFTITSKIDKQELTTDDVAALTLNIAGSGNLKLIEAPKLSLPTGVNTYDPQIVDSITGRAASISGFKTFTYAITPSTPGDYVIPPVEFTYYDPTLGGYNTLRTQEIKLTVKPGKGYNPAKVANVPLAIKDLHDIATKPLLTLNARKNPLLLSPVYWSMYALPLLSFLGILFWKRRSDDLSKDSMAMRNRRANKIALQRLATAQKLMSKNEKKAFYDEVSKAIWLYLSDKLGIPLSSLSRETATMALVDRKVPDALRQDFESVIWECETALYATGGNRTLASSYQDAVKVISNLEDII